MRYIARHLQDGSIKTGSYDSLRELDKRIWHLSPVISSIRKEKHNLLLIKKSKAVKAVYPIVKSGYVPHGIGKLFACMVIDSLTIDKGRSTDDYNNFMAVKRGLYGI